MTSPVFDEKLVRALATAESFARGRDYARRGAVFRMVRRGDRLTAEVEGSEVAPYDVTIDLHHGGVARTRCSCPYDWGDICKHVVAVLLQYLDAPDAVVKRPSLADVLRDVDRETLSALLIARAEIDQGLALWIEAELAADAGGSLATGSRRTVIDPEPIRRQAEALLSGRISTRRSWNDDGITVDEEAFSALIDKAGPFLQAGDGRNALKILDPVMEALVPAWLEQADWDETLHEFFPVLGQMIAEAVLMSDLLPEERDDLMVRLDLWQGMLDEYALDDHLQVAIDALEQGWDEIGLDDVLAGRGHTWPLSGEGDWTTARLTEARLRALDVSGRTEEFLNLAGAARRHGDHAAMLAWLGRIADALAYARMRFRSAEDVLKLSRLLRETGEIDAALDLAAWGLNLKPQGDRLSGAVSLARWLRDCAALLGRTTMALTAATAAFEHSLSIEDFEAAKILSGTRWPEFRQRLLIFLAAAQYAPDRIEIFLGEGMIDEAVQSVDVETMLFDPANEVLLRLAAAAHASHPDWVIDVCERMAADVMNAGRSGSYEQAVQWLEKAALAYDAAGRFEDWVTKIDALIEKHRRKHKLRPLLEAIRPRTS